MPNPKLTLKTIGEGIAGASMIGGMVLLSPILRPWYRAWGASAAEAQETLPGDEYVPQPKSAITLAITIRAPVEKVWPWFAQLGCQRGGWYIYDLLDNGGTPSAERIMPEYQQLKVGDIVKAMPKGDFGFPVAIVEPGRVLTLGGTLDAKTGKSAHPGDPGLEAYFSGDQTFYMQPVDGKHTRLIFRMRTDWNPSGMNHFAYGVMVEVASFIMGRKMLLNVKRRAENLAG